MQQEGNSLRFKTVKPVTVYMQFTGIIPRDFRVYDTSDQSIYYFRYLNGTGPRIKFNVPDPGIYITNVGAVVTDVRDIEIPSSWPEMPSPDRGRATDDEKIVPIDDPELLARNFTKQGVIQVGGRFYEQIKPVRLFILLHEKGHQFFSKEKDCDTYAVINFLRMGYNRYTAFYAIRDVLRASPERIERIKHIIEQLYKTEKK